nr:NmrA family NAD(P)-binding protein [Sphingobium sp. TCM1]
MTGASGMLGRPIIAALRGRGHRLKILSSSDTSAAKLQALGALEVVRGDFRNDADLDRLLAGADSVLHIPPSVVEDEDRIGVSMIAAARRAGIGHFLFMSCFHSIIPELRHHVNKLRVEQALLTSGLCCTILQPAMFMQNLGFIWPKVQATGRFAWPWDPERHYSMVDVVDIAEAAAIAMTDPCLRGGIYELCSNDILTGTQMAALLSDAMGRKVEAGKQDAAEWSAAMRATGAPAWTVETVAGMCAYHDAHGYDGGNGFVLEAIIGRKATRYAEFARRWVLDMRG